MLFSGASAHNAQHLSPTPLPMLSQWVEILVYFYSPEFRNAPTRVTAMVSSSNARQTGSSTGRAGGAVEG